MGLVKIFSLAIAMMISLNVFAQTAGGDEMNNSNNPLTPLVGADIQDYAASSLYGSNDSSNTFLFRGIVPHMTGGLPQIARLTIPYLSEPTRFGQVTGFGDLNFFDIFLVNPKSSVQVGVGPMIILPTASRDATGAHKWQIGAAAAAIAPQYWGLAGALITYQHDFAGDDNWPTQNIATLQPFWIYNLESAFYVRSTGVWNFNWQTGDYYIPVGFGFGKIWKTTDGSTLNLFGEPQWTVAHKGDGSPNFQVFFGLNMQFPMSAH